jgi:hypothetical protein
VYFCVVSMFFPTIFMSSGQAKCWCVPFSYSPSLFSWTFLMAYSKAKLKISHDKASPCFMPFWIGNLSDFCKSRLKYFKEEVFYSKIV